MIVFKDGVIGVDANEFRRGGEGDAAFFDKLLA